MKTVLTFCAAAVISLAAQSASAQVTARKTLTLDGAKRVAAAAVQEAKKTKSAGVIAVVDDGGNTMLVERLDNTFAAGANISIGKARTAALFKHPTRDFEKIIRDGRTPMVALNDFTPLMGGVPITVDGQIVGAVGVSGANSAQVDDQIATAAASALGESKLAADAQSSGVLFYPSDQVSSSFDKGAILFDGAGAGFEIHTSRRDKPGQVEVHARETDVIHVIDGLVTFVTGGAMVDGQEIASDEFRGRDITGGETRTLHQGDVIVVPAGVPHWFKEVPATFHYYVVKVKSER